MNPASPNLLCAAEHLLNAKLKNGWTVTSKIPMGNSTGGNFSVPYHVERNIGSKTQKAFLKALSFRQLASTGNFAKQVQLHTSAFNFEKEALELCKSKKMKRVASIIDAGEQRFPSSQLPVCYIIFEIAEEGNAHKKTSKFKQLDVAWSLRTLHPLCVAMKQLHTHNVAHQNLKPSNVLFFKNFGVKIGDFGCADALDLTSKGPRNHKAIVGDPSYAPPELFYQEVSIDWKERRIGCDLYLLGSMFVYFIAGGASMTGLWSSKLNPIHTPINWTSDYRSVLPYVRKAFDDAMSDLENQSSSGIPVKIFQLIRYLCEPDPKKRGHPNPFGTNKYDLQRFISSLDILAKRAELGL